MKILLHILKFKLLSLVKLNIEWKPSNIIKHASSLVVFGGFAVFCYTSARFSTGYLLETSRLGLFLLHRFLAMGLFVFFLSLSIGNIIVAYANLYRSQEVAYYLTKPLSFSSIFIIKFFDTFFYSSSVFLMISLAVLMGYGSYFRMSWLFYFSSMAFMLIPFMLSAACVAVIMLMICMRFIRVIGVKRMIVIMVILYLGVLYGYFAATNPLKLAAGVQQYYPRVDQYLGSLDPAFSKYLPNYWIADSLYWTVRGEFAQAVRGGVMILAVSFALFVLTMLTAGKLFYPGWIASMDVRISGPGKLRARGVFSLEAPPVMEPQASVILMKEFSQFRRDPNQWIHMGIISMLVFTFLVSLAQLNLSQRFPVFQTISYSVLILFNAFLIASVALRFVYPLMSIEGENFWVVRSAPVKLRKIFWLKYLVALVPVLLLGEMLVYFSHISLREYPMLLGVASVSMVGMSFALVGLNLGAGIFFTGFKEKNPIRAASSQGATLTFLISLLYLTAIVGLLITPASAYFAHVLRGNDFSEELLYYAVINILLVSLMVGAASLMLGLRSLGRDY